jgi:hypothetical protein
MILKKWSGHERRESAAYVSPPREVRQSKYRVDFIWQVSISGGQKSK